MKAYHFYLLRHGLTAGNEQGRYVGRLDLPLSAAGRRELARLHNKYAYPRADVFFTAPALRCGQSLGLLYPDARPTVVPGLAECDFGEFEGKTMAELKGDPRYRSWVVGAKNGDAHAAPPGGESSLEFQKRVCRAFGGIVTRLTSSGVTRAAIVASGGAIMTLLGVFGLPRRPFFEWTTRCGRGYEVILTPQLWMNGRMIEVIGEVPNARNPGEPSEEPSEPSPAPEGTPAGTPAGTPTDGRAPAAHRPRNRAGGLREGGFRHSGGPVNGDDGPVNGDDGPGNGNDGPGGDIL